MLQLVLLMALPVAASAQSCAPVGQERKLLGTYEHLHKAYQRVSHLGFRMAVAPSKDGGLVWCHFKGSPGAIDSLSNVYETDADGVQTRYRNPPTWLSDDRLLRGRADDDSQRACGRGLGPCYLREDGFREIPGRGIPSVWNFYIFDRQCEARGDGDWYVHRQIAQSTQLKKPRDGENPIVASYPFERRFEYRYDEMGRILEAFTYSWGTREPDAERPDALPMEMHHQMISTGVFDETICTGEPGGCDRLMAEATGPNSTEAGRGWAFCQAYAAAFGEE